jgi:hypothetical protein
VAGVARAAIASGGRQLAMDYLQDREPDARLDFQVAKLRRVDAWLRWLGVVLVWLTLGVWSCWEMRESLKLLSEYLSLTGVQYSVFHHLIGGGGGLIFCVSLTISSVFWQIGQSFIGLSARDRQRLENRVQKIVDRGNKHPLWRWIQ